MGGLGPALQLALLNLRLAVAIRIGVEALAFTVSQSMRSLCPRLTDSNMCLGRGHPVGVGLLGIDFIVVAVQIRIRLLMRSPLRPQQ